MMAPLRLMRAGSVGIVRTLCSIDDFSSRMPMALP